MALFGVPAAQMTDIFRGDELPRLDHRSLCLLNNRFHFFVRRSASSMTVST